MNLYVKSADGSGTAERLTTNPESHEWATDWADNGAVLILGNATPPGANILTLRLGTDAQPEILRDTEDSLGGPGEAAISPNGRWIAYSSDESGGRQIYVRPFPDVNSGGQRLVSDGPARKPLWGPDGRELLYLTPDTVMVLAVETGDTFQRGTPQRLFSMDSYYQDANLGWDISPDGQQFLMVKRDDAADPASESGDIVLVQNWFEELKRLVPTP